MERTTSTSRARGQADPRAAGWWVDAKTDRPVVVVNSKMAGAAVQRGPRVLSDQQIDLIARQLDQLCRDVED